MSRLFLSLRGLVCARHINAFQHMDCEIRENEIGVVFSEIDSYEEDSENVTDINVKCNCNLKDTMRDWEICVSSNVLVNVNF